MNRRHTVRLVIKMEKLHFPGFTKCLAMMRKHNAQTQEDGYHALLPHAAEHVSDLLEAFRREKDHGLRCWLLELISEAKAQEAFPTLAELLRSDDASFRLRAIWGLRKLGTKEARTLLWEARSYTFGTPAETAAFRAELEANRHG